MADGEYKVESCRFNMGMSVLGNRSHKLLCQELILINFWIFVTFLDLEKRQFCCFIHKLRQT
jgi:hypothetical protein